MITLTVITLSEVHFTKLTWNGRKFATWSRIILVRTKTEVERELHWFRSSFDHMRERKNNLRGQLCNENWSKRCFCNNNNNNMLAFSFIDRWCNKNESSVLGLKKAARSSEYKKLAVSRCRHNTQKFSQWTGSFQDRNSQNFFWKISWDFLNF